MAEIRDMKDRPSTEDYASKPAGVPQAVETVEMMKTAGVHNDAGP
jgi:hypothetical protein